MISTTEASNQPVVANGNNNDTMVVHRAGAKRSRDEVGELERATSTTKRKRRRHVSWAEKNSVQMQPDNRKLFEEYNDDDVWYTVCKNQILLNIVHLRPHQFFLYALIDNDSDVITKPSW